MQQVHQSARGHRQSEGGPQQLGELGQRHVLAVGSWRRVLLVPGPGRRNLFGAGPATRTARRIELLLEPFTAVLPAIPVLPQPGDLSLQFLNAAGIPLAPSRIRTAALPRRSHTCVSESTHRTYSPAARFLAATPVNDYVSSSSPQDVVAAQRTGISSFRQRLTRRVC